MGFPEIREADAPPEIADLYSRLREAFGIPLVNLIWRHAATMPGVLTWLVEAAAGVVASQVLSRARLALLTVPPIEHLPTFADAACELPLEERARLRTLVEVYNRGNTTNLLLLTALRRAISGEAIIGGGLSLPAAPVRAPQLPSLPALPSLESLPVEMARIVRGLAAHHEGIADAIPSLYLHLMAWPDLLAPLSRDLTSLFDDGQLVAIRDRLIRYAEETAPLLLPAMTPPGSFPAEYREETLSALQAFAGGLIAEMTVIGTWMAAALDQTR
ncbi:hypothetical protein GXW71_09935 [Roseomonas hellenica]|uniref:Uncharacterized protein n=1 Tax=Plastoroseomonas hellenica TaxID=2687306 RepID=A0ABS5EWI7_9PROT|nr:hypothetical protein [Plastoroseomonas hellenica]MBR0664670.1 hypothetical protein [Plastoroseomonas hellenica]